MAQQTIAVSGELGSGKSSVAQRLADTLGARRISTGAAQRQIAEQRGVTTLELNRLAEIDPGIDAEIDSVFRTLASVPEALVVDSRLAWHFLPDAYKVHLVVDPEEGARRVLGRRGTAAEHYSTMDEALERIADRAGSEQRRFLDLYGVDIFRLRNYDLVVDTSEAPPDDVAAGILDVMAGRFGGITPPVLLVAPSRVVPPAGLSGGEHGTGPAPGGREATAGAPRRLGYLRPRFYDLGDGLAPLHAGQDPGSLAPAELVVEDGEAMEGEPTLRRRWESIRDRLAGS